MAYQIAFPGVVLSRADRRRRYHDPSQTTNTWGFVIQRRLDDCCRSYRMFLSPSIVLSSIKMSGRFLCQIFCPQNHRERIPRSSVKVPARLTALVIRASFAAWSVVGGEAKQYRKSSVISRALNHHPICALPTTPIRLHRGLNLYLKTTNLFVPSFRYVPRRLAPGFAPVCLPPCRLQGYSQQFRYSHDLHWPLKTWFRF